MLFGRFQRVLTFSLVGLVCFAAQYSVAWSMARAGVSWPIGNALAFFLSAQLNFVLSSVFTWPDRGARRWTVRRWVSYNGTVLVALAVNTAVFTAIYPLAGSLAASAAGVVAGAGANFLICNYLVFRARIAPPRQAAAELTVEEIAA